MFERHKKKKEERNKRRNEISELQNKYTSTVGEYLGGIDVIPKGTVLNLVANTDTNDLMIFNFDNNLNFTVPLNNIISVETFTNRDVEISKKNGGLIKGMAATVLINPVAGIIVGTHKKKKKKVKLETYLNVSFIDRNGQNQTLIFTPLLNRNQPNYFRNFVEEMNIESQPTQL